MVKQIAIVGSGITGLIAAHGLLRAGYQVDLYSDRTARQWLEESRPTGTAARFDLARSYERELELNYWDGVAPDGEGVFLTFCPTLHNPLIRLMGRFEHPFQAVDVRLQSSCWLNEFETRGGRLFIEQVTVPRLSGIAAAHDLTVVAAGRADLCRLFPRDDARSVYDEPQRNLAMVITTGGPSRIDGSPMLPVKFDFLGTDGEIFFIPYFHKDHGPSWNLLVEAKPGSRMDRFSTLTNGDDAVAALKRVVAELFPWDEPFVRDMKLADPQGWLAGSVTPAVRRPVAQLSSGHTVMALGDTAISYDPIAAQGANSGVKQARHLVASIVARGDRPFDAAWMTATFDEFYAEHASHACSFSNLLLEPITAPARELLIAQYGSDGERSNLSGPQRIANAFVENFNDPRRVTPAFSDMTMARRMVAAQSGKPWLWNGVRGRASIARDQARFKLGRRGASQVTSNQ
ncbi:MAG TPA: styrene monooxygenase/indole monooxygenase family protein [Thermoanaerobaculia bacterium]|nr:styrene monooxygenase/indole monooxygenase family protein [Thermoanaerobaculia bacterium]